MMTDMAERLRWEAALGSHHECLLKTAADEIERLREALQEIANIKISHEDGVNKYIVFKARSTARAAIGAKIDE